MSGGRKVVVIDPGHGGMQPGAVGRTGLREADVNLLAAHLVKTRLERDHKVIMTRHVDKPVSLAARCALANAERAGLFVSIHCNAAANVLAQGTETYYLSAAGRRLAELIHHGLVSVGLVDRGIKQRAFYVLRHTRMLAVLVELAFISNPEDEAKLSSVDFLVRAADAIARGITEYERESDKDDVE